jgi:hypothetical protein
MKLVKFFTSTMLIILILAWTGCQKDEVDPNEIGGETNLDLTKVGGKFPVSLDAGTYIPGFQKLKDSIVITKNDNGIVTVRGNFGFDTTFTNGLAEALGISTLPRDLQQPIIDKYIKRFSATLDTSNKLAMSVTVDLKLKVTSEGIQEYHSSNGDLSKPFTIVKYGANVGDKYELTNSEGVKVTRTVAYKSTVDDYDVGLWKLKVIKVEETKDDPVTEKITFVTNHKYGLVGVILKTKNGKELKIGIFPPTL